MKYVFEKNMIFSDDFSWKVPIGMLVTIPFSPKLYQIALETIDFTIEDISTGLHHICISPSVKHSSLRISYKQGHNTLTGVASFIGKFKEETESTLIQFDHLKFYQISIDDLQKDFQVSIHDILGR